MTKSLMVQGTGSNVGKSVLTAGLCRAFSNRGHRVRPFKPQNMSNNAAVTEDGEISRAQFLQARACRTKPTVDMNPILLKPEGGSGSQVIVRGRRLATLSAKSYFARRPELLGVAVESYHRVCSDADIVIVEGAGSLAEVNLRDGDIANMGFARQVSIPVVLVADIDRGGVIAQLVGTQAVIDRGDEKLVRGFIVNKFRGDPSLFDQGYAAIEAMTGWKGIGVLPWLDEINALPAEDVQDLGRINPSANPTSIVCLRLPRIANFDDLDPLRLEPGVSVGLLEPGQALPGDTDLVIIPGSKSTRSDLDFLRSQGWDIDLLAHVRRGGAVLGICGGYQMLGRSIDDPTGIEGNAGTTEGLGLLNVETAMEPEKRVAEVHACNPEGTIEFAAYEIHMGRTCGPDTERPFALVCKAGSRQPDGAISADGRVLGTYLHGLFANDALRSAFLKRLNTPASDLNYEAAVDLALDRLANHITENLDVDYLLEIMEG